MRGDEEVGIAGEGAEMVEAIGCASIVVVGVLELAECLERDNLGSCEL